MKELVLPVCQPANISIFQPAKQIIIETGCAASTNHTPEKDTPLINVIGDFCLHLLLFICIAAKPGNPATEQQLAGLIARKTQNNTKMAPVPKI